MLNKRSRLDVVGYQQEIHSLLSKSDSLVGRGKSGDLRIKFNGKNYAINSDLVSHIDFLQEITPLPGSEDWMLGVCHSKGRVFLVIDASMVVGGSKTASGKLICLKGMDYAIFAELDNDSLSSSSPMDVQALTEKPVFVLLGQANSNELTKV